MIQSYIVYDICMFINNYFWTICLLQCMFFLYVLFISSPSFCFFFFFFFDESDRDNNYQFCADYFICAWNIEAKCMILFNSC